MQVFFQFKGYYLLVLSAEPETKMRHLDAQYSYNVSHHSLLPPKSAKSREILRKFKLIAVQGHPRLSILVSIGSEYATSY